MFFVTLALEDSGIQAPTTVVTDNTTWQEVWRQHARFTPQPPAPVVDFPRQTVAIVRGVSPHGCWSASRVVSVRNTGIGIDVSYVTPRNTAEGTNRLCLQVFTTPAHIVVFENPSGLPVGFLAYSQ